MQSTQYDVFIIEGIDRLGKDTLIQNIQQELGHHFVLHFSKPQCLKAYEGNCKLYQQESFEHGFSLIDSAAASFFRYPVIFNRFHLGENVYAPLYRGYDGSYVFDIEEDFCAHTHEHVNLILLTTSDFSFIHDDGESFDFSKKEEEQDRFKEAFNRSIFQNKVMVDVSNGQGGFKDPMEILKEVLA